MEQNNNRDAARSAPGQRGGPHGRRWLVPVVIVLGLALHLPSLNMGFFYDDYGHQLILRGIAQHQGMRPWSLYDFGVRPASEESAWEAGMFPWWTSADFKIRFFRPVTSLTLWLDYALFGDWATGYHLSSLVWYAVLLGFTCALYRSLGLAANTAVVALALLAASDSGVLPVNWPANRTSLLAVLFTVGSVLAVSRHQSWGRGPALGVGLALAGLACLAKETGVTAFVLLAWYLLWQRRATDSAGFRRWAAAGAGLSLLAAGLYVVVLLWEGYGTNTVFYTPPWSHPGAFAQRTAVLFSVGALSLLGCGSLDLLSALPSSVVVPAAVLSVALGGGLAGVVWKRVRGHGAAGFLLVWMVVTMLGQGCAPPSERLLFAASVGSSGLLALFLSAVVFGRTGAGRPRWSRRVGLALLATAGLASAVSTAVFGFQLSRMAAELRETTLGAELGEAERGSREVFILQSPNAFVPLAMTWVRSVEAGDRGTRYWPMQTGRRGLRWTRLDQGTFELESLDRPLLSDFLERLMLTERAPPAPGTRWETALFTVEAIESGAGGLRRIRVRCPHSLDSGAYCFLMARGERLAAISPPPVGESVVIPAAMPPHWFAP